MLVIFSGLNKQSELKVLYRASAHSLYSFKILEKLDKFFKFDR